jgi:hypothetical protein
MKKVFNSASDVIHLFAQRSQEEARCSNVFFQGNTIYSYGSHYKLGHFLDSDSILINDLGYSATTSKHISIILVATRHYKQFKKTKTDLDLVYNSVIWNTNKLARANKPELYINPILSLWNSLNEYMEYDRKSKKLSKKNYQNYFSDQYNQIKTIVNALNNGSDDFKEKLRLSSIKLDKAQKTKDAKDLKIKLVKFYNYKIDSFTIGKEDYLRISKDGQNIETSQRVKVSIESAISLYKMILAKIDIIGIRIENFTVSSINGTLKIGCHNINMNSVHNVGTQINKIN